MSQRTPGSRPAVRLSSRSRGQCGANQTDVDSLTERLRASLR